MTKTGKTSQLRWLRPVVALCALAVIGIAAAQEKPLRENEVTERALVDALAPVPGAADEAQGAEPGATGRKTRGFKLSTPHPVARHQSIMITFNTDSSDLLPQTRTMLDVVAKALKSDKLASLSVTIEGHADPRGSEDHNLSLSQSRAESVVAYLVNKHGIAKERLQAVGKGSAEALNRADPAAAENRRVSIVTQPQ